MAVFLVGLEYPYRWGTSQSRPDAVDDLYHQPLSVSIATLNSRDLTPDMFRLCRVKRQLRVVSKSARLIWARAWVTVSHGWPLKVFLV